MTARMAACACGDFTVTVEGEPFRISVCHCLDCKRRSGSAFAWTAHYPRDQAEVRGPFHSFTRSSDEGYWARFHFCPRCGNSVFYEIERRPGAMSIPVGAFADPEFPPPGVEVFEERRCPWLPPLAPLQE